MKRRRELVVSFLAALLVFGCRESGTKTDTVKDMVSGEIEKELHAGSSREDITEFFIRHKMSYAFDESNQRFEIATKTADLESVLTLIYLNRSQTFARAEVQEISTGP